MPKIAHIYMIFIQLSFQAIGLLQLSIPFAYNFHPMQIAANVFRQRPSGPADRRLLFTRCFPGWRSK